MFPIKLSMLSSRNLETSQNCWKVYAQESWNRKRLISQSISHSTILIGPTHNVTIHCASARKLSFAGQIHDYVVQIILNLYNIFILYSFCSLTRLPHYQNNMFFLVAFNNFINKHLHCVNIIWIIDQITPHSLWTKCSLHRQSKNRGPLSLYFYQRPVK